VTGSEWAVHDARAQAWPVRAHAGEARHRCQTGPTTRTMPMNAVIPMDINSGMRLDTTGTDGNGPLYDTRMSKGLVL